MHSSISFVPSSTFWQGRKKEMMQGRPRHFRDEQLTDAVVAVQKVWPAVAFSGSVVREVLEHMIPGHARHTVVNPRVFSSVKELIEQSVQGSESRYESLGKRLESVCEEKQVSFIPQNLIAISDKRLVLKEDKRIYETWLSGGLERLRYFHILSCAKELGAVPFTTETLMSISHFSMQIGEQIAYGYLEDPRPHSHRGKDGHPPLVIEVSQWLGTLFVHFPEKGEIGDSLPFSAPLILGSDPSEASH